MSNLKNFYSFAALALFIGLFFSTEMLYGQKIHTRADTLRGSIGPARAWWEVQHYGLEVEIFPKEKIIKDLR